ncbi:MAG: hypothetical protein R2856_21770 [Caldilineaceae bacterium]
MKNLLALGIVEIVNQGHHLAGCGDGLAAELLTQRGHVVEGVEVDVLVQRFAHGNKLLVDAQRFVGPAEEAVHLQRFEVRFPVGRRASAAHGEHVAAQGRQHALLVEIPEQRFVGAHRPHVAPAIAPIDHNAARAGMHQTGVVHADQVRVLVPEQGERGTVNDVTCGVVGNDLVDATGIGRIWIDHVEVDLVQFKVQPLRQQFVGGVDFLQPAVRQIEPMRRRIRGAKGGETQIDRATSCAASCGISSSSSQANPALWTGNTCTRTPLSMLSAISAASLLRNGNGATENGDALRRRALLQPGSYFASTCGGGVRHGQADPADSTRGGRIRSAYRLMSSTWMCLPACTSARANHSCGRRAWMRSPMLTTRAPSVRVLSS